MSCLHAITLLLLLISALQRMVAAQSFTCFVIHTALRCVRLMTSQGLTEMTSSNSLSFIPTNAKSCVHRFSFRHGIKAHPAAAGKEWVDCNAKGVSKWTALSYLIDRFDLLPDEVCCFGDNLNDIEMLPKCRYKLRRVKCPPGSYRSRKTHLCALLGKRST